MAAPAGADCGEASGESGVMATGRLLAQALGSYQADGRAHTTLPLLTAAGNKLDAALLKPMLLKKLQLLGSAVDDNAVLVQDVLEGCGLDKWVDRPDEPASKRAKQDDDAAAAEAERQASTDKEQHREDVRCVFKQLAREWSTDGEEERRRIHAPLLAAILKYCPPSNSVCGNSSGSGRGFPGSGQPLSHLLGTKTDPEHGSPTSSKAPLVLVPGSGLGRLATEIAGHGYRVQACESGAAMAAMAEFLLQHIEPEAEYRVHPFIHDAANRSDSAAQARALLVPDKDPLAMLASAPGFSLAATDFVEEYARPEHAGQWDVIVTCFFIDTAPNPLVYLRTISHCLRSPGGRWINTGPLLWHHALSDPYECLQLSAAEMLSASELCGFTIEVQSAPAYHTSDVSAATEPPHHHSHCARVPTLEWQY